MENKTAEIADELIVSLLKSRCGQLEGIIKLILEMNPFRNDFGMDGLSCLHCSNSFGIYQSKHEQNCSVPRVRIRLREAGFGEGE